MKKILTFYSLATFLFIYNTFTYAQSLTCKSNLSISVRPYICTAIVSPLQLVEPTTSFDSLGLSNTLFEVGLHDIIVYGYHKGEKIDSCLTNLQVYIPTPIHEQFRPDTLRISNTEPYLLTEDDVRAFKYKTHCIEQTVSFTPKYVYCNDKNIKSIRIKYTDKSGYWYETWNEIYIQRPDQHPCSNQEDLMIAELTNDVHIWQRAHLDDQIDKITIYDMQGRLVEVIHSTATIVDTMIPGVNIIRIQYKNGNIITSKVVKNF